MLPFVLVGMDVSVKASGLPLIVLFLGVLGTSVGLTRLKENKMVERLAALPLSRRRMIFEHLAANVLMDGLQSVIPAALIIYSFGLTGMDLLFVAFALILSIILANAVGSLLAMVSGGSGEVHLYSGMAVLVLAATSGLFFRDLPEGMSTVSGLMPLSLLSGALTGTPMNDVGWHIAGSVILTLTVVVLVWQFAARFFRL